VAFLCISEDKGKKAGEENDKDANKNEQHGDTSYDLR
jgi:hypothetical protein